MTTIAASPLSGALQTLVDARLDTIDRMLLGRVDRQDRLAIVREVESQIFDLLGGRDSGSLDRDDVLAVLARLDPPEAYLTDGDSNVGTRPFRIPATSRAAFAPRRSRLALSGGLLGIGSMALALLSYPFAILLESEIILAGFLGLAFIMGLLAIVFAGMARLRGPWAIAGLVTGIIATTAVLGMSAFFLIGG